MMLKYLKIFITFLIGHSATSCDGFLGVSSPSLSNIESVYATVTSTRASLDNIYRLWTLACDYDFFGDGLFYAADLAGSDIERHPESFDSNLQRHYPETLYLNGKYTFSYDALSYQHDGWDGAYSRMFKVIAQANSLINTLDKDSNFKSCLTDSIYPTMWTQMYGEAIALRATAYRELIKFYGDVPYSTTFGVPAMGLTPRDYIYDKCIKDLLKVEPLMYKSGEIPGFVPSQKRFFTRTYVQGLIGRMCLDAAGYQTRRYGIIYKNGSLTPLTFIQLGEDNNNSFYARRSDYLDLYKIAKAAYERLLFKGSGNAVFHLTDPRGVVDSRTGKIYDNPYQYFFHQMLSADVAYADESIVEYPIQQGIPNEPGNRGYACGRPSSGPEKNGYPGKAYAQCRINPAYYFGVFAPNDKRRDVSITVTGSSGYGVEVLIPFIPNSKAEGGGLSSNKFDENRQAHPWTSVSGRSGINGPYMRMAEIYLAYAETCAVLGDDVTAMRYLSLVRERSFPQGEAHTEGFILNCGSLFNAIIEERGFEFAGEGDRRWTLIRTGLLPQAIKRIKTLTKLMIDGLRDKGYYTFDNGNTISEYVWTKLVDARSKYGYRLTTQCLPEYEDDPVLFPGWRGQHDNWESLGLDYKTDNPKTNLAIKGLFKHIQPDSQEAKKLEADGYSKQNYGHDLIMNGNDDEYYTYLFYQYDYIKAPIYLWPFTPNVMITGGFVNGYGFY